MVSVAPYLYDPLHYQCQKWSAQLFMPHQNTFCHKWYAQLHIFTPHHTTPCTKKGQPSLITLCLITLLVCKKWSAQFHIFMPHRTTHVPKMDNPIQNLHALSHYPVPKMVSPAPYLHALSHYSSAKKKSAQFHTFMPHHTTVLPKTDSLAPYLHALSTTLCQKLSAQLQIFMPHNTTPVPKIVSPAPDLQTSSNYPVPKMVSLAPDLQTASHYPSAKNGQPSSISSCLMTLPLCQKWSALLHIFMPHHTTALPKMVNLAPYLHCRPH